MSQQQIVASSRQKFAIINDLGSEWDFIDGRISVEEVAWKNSIKPTDPKEIAEDKMVATELEKLYTSFVKLNIAHLKYQEEKAKSNIKLYTWQKVPNKTKSTKLFQIQQGALDDYYKIKKQFLKKYPPYK